MPRYVSQAERGDSVIGGVEHDSLETQVSYDIRLVGLEGGEDVHIALREDARVKPDADFLDARTIHAGGFQYGEIVGRDGDFVAECLALPILRRADAGFGEREERLLPALSEQRDGDDGQSGIGAALEDGVGVHRRELDFLRHEQVQMLALRGVADFDRQILLGEVAHLLGDIRRDERQVGLRLEPRHEGHGARRGFFEDARGARTVLAYVAGGGRQRERGEKGGGQGGGGDSAERAAV